MKFDFNKIKATGKEYFEKGKDAATDLAGKAKAEAKVLNNQAKLAKAQRELGALVYSLAKNGENNQPLVDKYIDTISALEQEIEQLRTVYETPDEVTVEGVYVDMPEEEAAPVEEAPAEPAVPTCGQCGAEVPEDALFCNKCGAQL